MKPRLSFSALIVAIVACSDHEKDDTYSQVQCDDLRDHIMSRLQDEVRRGTLVGTAVPCGDDGLANRQDFFDSRTLQGEVDRISSEFLSLCSEFDARCERSEL